VHNFVEFVATGRATSALADALAQAEEQVKTLRADVASLESSKDDLFTPPPRTWVADRVKKLKRLLERMHGSVEARAAPTHGSRHLDARKPGSREILLSGFLSLSGFGPPPRCGGRFEFIALVDAPGAGNRSTAGATPREASGGNQLTESRRPTKEQSPPGAG
jgi:hypothetical protein